MFTNATASRELVIFLASVYIYTQKAAMSPYDATKAAKALFNGAYNAQRD